MRVGEAANDYLAELCEAIVAQYSKLSNGMLVDLCSQVSDKADCSEATMATYISTENLLQNKGGKQPASSLPSSGKVTRYKRGDTLVSNIRPYFKKVWYAPEDGTCSGDVLVFRANDPDLAPYLHSCLRQDGFFKHVMHGAKGTKMPRGDRKQMMEFPISTSCSTDDLATLSASIELISKNDRESAELADLRDMLLPKLMSGEINIVDVESSI